MSISGSVAKWNGDQPFRQKMDIQLGICQRRPYIVNAQICLLSIVFAIIPLMGCRKPVQQDIPTQTGTADQTEIAAPKSRDQTASDPNRSRYADRLKEAERYLSELDLKPASELITQALIERPDDNAALLLASRIEIAKGNPDAAKEMARSITATGPSFTTATDIIVQLLVQERALEAAVQRLEFAVEQSSLTEEQRVRWHQQLWEILSRLGRRQEASKYADRLCRAGRYNQEILTSLLRRGDAYPIAIKDRAPESFFMPGHGLARWWFSQEAFDKALEELSRGRRGASDTARTAGEIAAQGSGEIAAHAFLGRLLAETQATDKLAQWYAGCDEQTQEFADYWVALGVWFYQQQQLEASARALMEAVYRDPTDDDACHRLARVLAALNRKSDSQYVREHATRVALLRELAIKISLGETTPEMLADLPQQLLTLGRPFETIGWTLNSLPPGQDQRRRILFDQHAALRQNPMTLTMASELALTEIDRSEFAIEQAFADLSESNRLNAATKPVGNPDRHSSPTKLPPSPVVVKLENVADVQGLQFQWHHADKINLDSLPLHEMMGGGIGILDYDLDGYPDIYLAQGSGEPPNDACTRSNQMFRNNVGRFADVTRNTGTEDFHYGSGIAVGDVNQDGFPDLYLGALGQNRLLINNGDGTFQDNTPQLGAVPPQFTSSVGIADLTADGLPELFECVYVEMQDGFRLPDKDKDGSELAPGPNEFYAEADRWSLALGDGRFETKTVAKKRIEPGTALGLMITDFDGDGANDVFVSNDARPNHLLIGFNTPDITNIADLVGLGVGFRGFSNSCMGIAAGDFNRDGSIDLHVTNFTGESANHFIQGKRGIFSDDAARYQLTPLTSPFTGFGIAAVDFGWDGWLDFLVANGHVFDQRDRGKAFQMPTQPILNLQDHYVGAAMTESEGYLGGRYVGRAVATLDFDRDLDLDFVVGHLDAPTALLRNNTTRRGDGIQLVLVGTKSERDAIGSRIRVNTDAGEFTHWVTAGNGYLSANQSIIDIGLGKANRVNSIEMTWSSGTKQTFQNLTTNQRYLLIEGEFKPWLDEISRIWPKPQP
ncbi:MAG: FG-GAP-like repeat-containing protein [Rubripirellula sp.]|nr:FG-GAP-like repeat-containing protein [Rubripirellula sp.]